MGAQCLGMLSIGAGFYAGNASENQLILPMFPAQNSEPGYGQISIKEPRKSLFTHFIAFIKGILQKFGRLFSE